MLTISFWDGSYNQCHHPLMYIDKKLTLWKQTILKCAALRWSWKHVSIPFVWLIIRFARLYFFTTKQLCIQVVSRL
jgi:hypothetical protein